MSISDTDSSYREAPLTPQFRHIVNGRRTAKQDIEYRTKAYQSWRELTWLIQLAEQFHATQQTYCYGTARARELRRELFGEEIASAREQLGRLRTLDDAVDVGIADVIFDYLADATYEYINVRSDRRKRSEHLAFLERSL
jgi:hypothetical protein